MVHTNLGCGAGNLVASISLSGGHEPCSFLGPDYIAGSVAERSFAELWHDSAGFRAIRSLPDGNACGTCASGDGHADACGGHFSGGCRARALVLNGHINAADPWLTPGGPHPLRTLLCGGVWEWTADWYDAQYYANCPAESPTGPESGAQKVIRGGSWADCAEVVTVSFRASRASSHWRDDTWGDHMTPNIGFRLCRVESAAKPA